jgi:ribokinase
MTGSVTVVGSLSVDFVVRVPRRPQKGETIAGFDFKTFVGGKGNNQALAAARAGASVKMVGRVGTDTYGERLIETLRTSGVNTSYMTRDADVGTGVAHIYVDPEGDNSIVIVPQANSRLLPEHVRAAEDALYEAKVVLLQMEIPADTIIEAARLGQKANAIVILNPAPAPPSGKLPAGLLPYVDLIVPNQTELELLTGVAASDQAGARQGALQLMQNGAAQVIVTMGDQGALLVRADGRHQMVPSFKVDAIDTTAAGDAFCGALAAALSRDIVIEQAIRFACAAGALAVTKHGAEPSLPSLAEIEGLNQSIQPMNG